MTYRLRWCLSRLSWTLCGVLAALLAFKTRVDRREPSPFLPMGPVQKKMVDISSAEEREPRFAEKESDTAPADFPVDEYTEDSERSGSFDAESPSVPRYDEEDRSNSSTPWLGWISRPRRVSAVGIRQHSIRAGKSRMSAGVAPHSRPDLSKPYRDALRRENPRQSQSPARGSARTGQSAERSTPFSRGRAQKETETSGVAKAMSHLKSFFEKHAWDGRKNSYGARSFTTSPDVVRQQDEMASTEKKPRAKPPASSARSGSTRLRPPGMREVLGKDVLRPPAGHPTPPDFSKIEATLPRVLRDGTPLRLSPPTPDELENLKPPSPQEKSGKTRFPHAGPAWAVPSGDHWVWLASSSGRWWTLAQGKQPLLWHAGHWWWDTRDGWFLLHDGQPWAFRQFHELKTEGLIHPVSGTRVIYSSDSRRAAIISPDGRTVVYDLETGKEIGRWQKKGEPSE